MVDKSITELPFRQADHECMESELDLGREIGIAGLYVSTLSTWLCLSIPNLCYALNITLKRLFIW